MAEFEAKVYRLKIEEHPNADRLELAVVGDYRSIVQKGQFKTGDLGVYIPEAAVCPDWLIARLGLEGKLSGKAKNRVKAVKLRGILSQGLIYPVGKGAAARFISNELNDKIVQEGDVVTDFLGLVKWEPPIPIHMRGEVKSAFGKTIKYDIENWKKYPDVIYDGEKVVMTEKIHGTWCCFGYHPDLGEGVDSWIVTSKGLSDKGLVLKLNKANENNLYFRALMATANPICVIERAISDYTFMGLPFYILGEVFGRGVQDLHYGAYADKTPAFRVFDIYFGEPGKGEYLAYNTMKRKCEQLGLEVVPTLYAGPFSKEVMLEHTTGHETVSGKGLNIREGVVIKTLVEREVPELGRVILKSVSEDYLLRKNATEFN